MADDPAGTAATNNPELSTLVAAIEAAGLTDTLNGTLSIHDGDANVACSNILVGNGTVHIIDQVLVPQAA